MSYKKLRKDNPKRIVGIGKVSAIGGLMGFPTKDIDYVSFEWVDDPISKQPYVQISVAYTNPDNPKWYHKPFS